MRVLFRSVECGVQAFDLQTGATLWTFDSDLALSGGPGVGDGLVVVGSLEGDVIAPDAGTGAARWRAKVENEVIAAPAVGQGKAFVRSTAAAVTALDADPGERRRFWPHALPLPPAPGNDPPSPRPGSGVVG